MIENESPFKDIEHLILDVPALDMQSADYIKSQIEVFEGPKPALGVWEPQLSWLASVQKKSTPVLDRPVVAVFAGSHNVAKVHKPDLDVAEAAKARILSLTHGQAAVRGMAGELGAAFKVYEMGLEYPVADITQAPALTERECAAAFAFGMEVVAEGADIIVLGNAGLGSATAAAAIARGLYGGTSDYWAGAHDISAENRIKAVEIASRLHKATLSHPLGCLQVFGGRDISGLVGAILAARYQNIPVILDGFVVCAAAAVLHEINPAATEHCRVGHLTIEPAHEAIIDRLGLEPLNNFEISLGDATGSVFAVASLRLALAGLGTMSERMNSA